MELREGQSGGAGGTPERGGAPRRRALGLRVEMLGEEARSRVAPSRRAGRSCFFVWIVSLGLLFASTAAAQTPVLTGRVIDADGRPMVGASVVVFDEWFDADAEMSERLQFLTRFSDTHALSFPPVAEVETDANGAFAAFGKAKPIGHSFGHRVLVVGPDGAVRGYRYVRAGTELEVKFERPTLRWGRLETRKGEPLVIPGEVHLAPETGSSLDIDIVEIVVQRLTPAIGRIHVQADGTFRVATGEGLEPVAVTFSAPGFQPLRVEAKSLGVDDPIAITMEPGRRLAGQVVTAAGEPAAGATVRIKRKGAQSDPIGRPDLECDAEGRFEIDTLAPGAYAVSAHRPGSAAVRVDATANGTDLRLVLPAGTTFAGRVVDSRTQDPIAGAEIRVPAGEGFQHVGSSTEDGSFEIHGVQLSKQPQTGIGGAPATPITVSASGFTIGRLPIPTGDGPLEVKLDRFARLSGSVRNAAEEPVGNVEITATVALESGLERVVERSWSRADGTFRLDSIDPGQPIHVKFSVEGLPAFQRTFAALEPGASIDTIEARFSAPLTVSGRVIDGSGRPIAGAVIGVLGESSLRQNAARLDHSTTSGPDGTFTLTGLPSGEHQLLASRAGHLGQRVTVRGQSGETVSTTIELEVSGTVRGTVVDAEGAPVAGAQVEVLDTSDGFRRVGAQTDEAGRVELTGFGTDPVRVTIEGEGYRRLRVADVSTTSGESFTWVLEKE